MGTRSPEIDRYIDGSPEFARPILQYLRDVVHEACPQVEEAMKWSTPAFQHHGLLCGMAAHKRHCSFGFWKGELMTDGHGRPVVERIGKIQDVAELPDRHELLGLVRAAMKLNEERVRVPRKAKPRPPVVVPKDLVEALRGNARARETFESFSPSHRREYVEWITEAKRDETRKRRLLQAVEWMAEGKPRNWKYIR
jgi:hypothetical protein